MIRAIQAGPRLPPVLLPSLMHLIFTSYINPLHPSHLQTCSAVCYPRPAPRYLYIHFPHKTKAKTKASHFCISKTQIHGIQCLRKEEEKIQRVRACCFPCSRRRVFAEEQEIGRYQVHIPSIATTNTRAVGKLQGEAIQVATEAIAQGDIAGVGSRTTSRLPILEEYRQIFLRGGCMIHLT